MLSNGFKKAIRTGARSVIAQKVAEAVVAGATLATQRAAEGTVNEAINTATPHVKESVKMLISRKRSHTSTTTITTPIEYDVKKSKININSLIDGSGIVLD